MIPASGNPPGSAGSGCGRPAGCCGCASCGHITATRVSTFSPSVTARSTGPSCPRAACSPPSRRSTRPTRRPRRCPWPSTRWPARAPTTPGSTCGPRWGRARRTCTCSRSAWPGPPIPRCCVSSATCSTPLKPPAPPRRCRWRCSATRRSGAPGPTRRWSAGGWPARSATGETRTPPRPAGTPTPCCSHRCCGPGPTRRPPTGRPEPSAPSSSRPAGLRCAPTASAPSWPFSVPCRTARKACRYRSRSNWWGAPGSGRTSLAAHVAAALGQPCRGLVAVDADAIAASPDPAASAVREIRRARLERRAVLWEHADALPATAWPALGGSPLTFLSTPGELTAPAGFSLGPALVAGPAHHPGRTDHAVVLAGPGGAAAAGHRMGLAPGRGRRGGAGGPGR